MRDLFLGIDAGSSVLKAAAFDADGTQISLASQRTPLSRPRPGWVEADPTSCLDALFAVIADAAEQSGDPGAIRAIGISGAMVGAWLVDAQGLAIRPGINWEDSRSQPMIDGLIAQRPSFLSDVFSISGSALQQGCTLPVLAWLNRHEPEALTRTAHVLTYKDFLRMHLTGVAAADRSESAVLPGSARDQARSPELFEMFGIGALMDRFPQILDPQDVAGQLTLDAATRTGLQAGVPVVAGAGDVIANVIGAGGLATGAATGILGTTCMVGVCHDKPVFTPPDLGLLFSLPERHWYRSMVNVAGTLNLDWAVGTFAPNIAEGVDPFATVTEMVRHVPAGANGVTYLPYLSKSGIIAPVADANARAQFCGLHAGHDQADLLRAVYEGVAFAIADLIDLLSLPAGSPLVLTGGGSRSPVWCQMIADVSRCPISVLEGSEFGAKGAALLAASALGHHDSVSAASQRAKTVRQTFVPAPSAATVWANARARYSDYRDRLIG